MPIYTYECMACGTAAERTGIGMEDRDEQNCSVCGGTLERKVDLPVLSAPNQNPRNSKYPYMDRGLGCVVHSETERRAEMSKQGLVEKG